MPEKPEAQVMSDWLHKLLSGKILSNFTSDLLDLSNLSSWLPLTLQAVCCRGKKIIFCFLKEQSVIYLITSLGMTGRWVLPQVLQKKWLHGTLTFTDGTIIEYDDQRKFGRLELTTDVSSSLADVGPDLLHDVISEAYWFSCLQHRSDWEIAPFLLEQNFVSGIGNYLKSEILYLAQVAPQRKICTLSEEEARKILYYAQERIRTSYQVGGCTLERFLAPDGSYGGYIPLVYGRQLDPYGNQVQKITQKTRSTFWVPLLQQ